MLVSWVSQAKVALMYHQFYKKKRATLSHTLRKRDSFVLLYFNLSKEHAVLPHLSVVLCFNVKIHHLQNQFPVYCVGKSSINIYITAHSFPLARTWTVS